MANIFITIAVFVGNVFYQGLGFYYPLKIVCSSGFALMGIINMIHAYKKIVNKKLTIYMTAGLIFAFLGDVAINPNFIVGVILFALGHVFLVASYLVYKKLDKLDVIFSAGLGTFSIIFILCFPYLIFEVAVLRYVVLVYAVIISVMVGKSFGNVIRAKSCFSNMIMSGSVLFFVSDMMLLLAWFSSIEGQWTSNLCMAAYYPGLCLLAGSMLPYIKEERIARITKMESFFDKIQAAYSDNDNIIKDIEIETMLRELKEYYENGQWRADFEADERGELPANLKRGILTEDAIYNLFCEIEKERKRDV